MDLLWWVTGSGGQHYLTHWLVWSEKGSLLGEALLSQPFLLCGRKTTLTYPRRLNHVIRQVQEEHSCPHFERERFCLLAVTGG